MNLRTQVISIRSFHMLLSFNPEKQLILERKRGWAYPLQLEFTDTAVLGSLVRRILVVVH